MFGGLQLPKMHCTVGGPAAVHTLPQPPQFCVSELVSTHAPPGQVVSLQVVRHENPSHITEWLLSGGLGHGEHESSPQVSSWSFLTQPRVSQWCCPVGHKHKPSEQCSPASQRLPQNPQLLLSDVMSRHRPPQSCVGEGHE